MEEVAKLLGMLIAGGGLAIMGRFIRDRWKHQADYREQESRLNLEESKEHQAMAQDGESYALRELKSLMRERQKIHEADKEEILGMLGNTAKRVDECEKDRVKLRVYLARVIQAFRQIPGHTLAQEQDFFRPIEMWEQAQDAQRVEESKKQEDDSVH